MAEARIRFLDERPELWGGDLIRGDVEREHGDREIHKGVAAPFRAPVRGQGRDGLWDI